MLDYNQSSTYILEPLIFLTADDVSPDHLLARQHRPVYSSNLYRDNRVLDGSTLNPETGERSVGEGVSTTISLRNLPCFQFQAILDSIG